MSKRVLLGRLFHETHTFLKGRTTVADFSLATGDGLLRAEGDGSTNAGSLQVAASRGWEVIPTVAMEATPSGMVTDEVVELFWDRFSEAALRESPGTIDGICLNLHGAMVSDSYPDVEGEILRRIRRLPSFAKIPLCGALDLHANFSPVMAHTGTALVAYRANPHTDSMETAVRAAFLLDRLMEGGVEARTVRLQPPFILPPSGTGTADLPMRQLGESARRAEADSDHLLAVNVFAGFSFADIDCTGISFSAITTGETSGAMAVLQELAALATETRRDGVRPGLSLTAAMHLLAAHRKGPVLLVEPADNIGGGAPGDLTHVLRALVEHGVDNAAVCLNDPEAVDALWDVPAGRTKRLPIGGKSGEIGAEAIIAEVSVISRSDGRYTLEDAHSHAAATGIHQQMGRCVVAKFRGVRVLLTSRKTPPFDLGQWRSQGIEPGALFAIGVKAAVAHRQAYDPISQASYTLDTPGPCAENLALLPYRNVRRPVWPLDAID